MDIDLYDKLKKIREDKQLQARLPKFVKPTFVGLDGVERPLSYRYYQVQGILHLVAMQRFLLGDDVGLGKTIQSISALCFLWERDPSLRAVILTNKSAIPQWVGEFDKFTSGIQVFMCSGSAAQRAKIYQKYQACTEPCAIVLGYRTAIQDFETLRHWQNTAYVLDECTAFKNTQSQVHQAIKYLTSTATRVWGLTATMIKNNLMEGYGIYRVLVPDLFKMSKHAFMTDYCITRLQTLPGSRRQIPMIVGYRSTDVARFKSVIDPYYLGRPKFEVASELPPLISKTMKVDLTPEQHEKYLDAIAGFLEVTRDGNTEEKEVSKLTAVTFCQQIVNHPELIGAVGSSNKIDSLLDILGEGDLQGEKVIVYTRFRTMVDILMRELAAAKIKAVRITGAEDELQRKAAQDAFQKPDSEVKVICITSAAAEAINLQAAKAVIFYDSPWSAGEYIQILGRMIRIGSVHDRVFAIHLVTTFRSAKLPTIDQRVQEVLKKKMTLVESVLGKRVKGESEDFEVSVENEISDLFSALRQDAKEVRKK